MWVLTVWELFAIACTSKEVIANLIRLFVGATAEEVGNDYNPSQQLWLDAGENRGSHSLCTISVNVDCRDEFGVCYGVYAMSRELNFLTCGLEVLSSQTVSVVYYRRQESSVIRQDCKKRLHRSSDLSRSQEAERILLCETVNSCWQWIQSKHHVRVPKRGSYYLGNNSVRPRDKRDTDSRRSADNLASLQTSSHSVYQAIPFAHRALWFVICLHVHHWGLSLVTREGGLPSPFLVNNIRARHYVFFLHLAFLAQCILLISSFPPTRISPLR